MDPNGNDGQESDPDEGIELYDDDNDMPAGNFIWLCYMFCKLFTCCIFECLPTVIRFELNLTASNYVKLNLHVLLKVLLWIERVEQSKIVRFY